jgi:branched-chain amino acid transport system substrate-binding protein
VPDDGTRRAPIQVRCLRPRSLFGKGAIRADGRKIHPAYLFEVKKPADSKYPWDYYNLVATIPAEEAFRPLDQGNCPMVAKKN